MAELKVGKKSIFSLMSEMKGRKFIIPDYQRPYKWDVKKCETLWQDITAFFDGNGNKETDNEYYLATIVTCERSGDDDRESGDGDRKRSKNLEIIDGQQRITSFFLILRAFYTKLENTKEDDKILGLKNLIGPCIWDVDRISQQVIDKAKIHIESQVVATETNNKNLHDILKTGKVAPDDKSKYATNYKYFLEQCDAYARDNPTYWQGLCVCILDQCVIFPVECDELETALTIFSTLNDRGMPLSDSDIFKAKLYRLAQQNKEEEDFIERWNTFVNDAESLSQETKEDIITYMFRCNMYLQRAIEGDTTKPVGLRQYYDGMRMGAKKKTSRTGKKLEERKWQDVMLPIERLLRSWSYILELKNQLRGWWDVIRSLGDDAPFYPALFIVYINMNFETEHPHLEPQKVEMCTKTLKNLARYSFAKTFYKKLEGPSVDLEMYKASREIAHENGYCPGKIPIDQDFLNELNNPLTPRFRKRFVILGAYLDEKQEYQESMKQVEHILPRKWDNNYYDKWTKDNVNRAMDTLGNLVLLEWRLNIGGGNKFFNKKKDHYKKSKIAQVQELLKIDDWTYESYLARHEALKSRLKDFFEHDYV